jgi:tetratricopeptide (TPR) repeat protein
MLCRMSRFRVADSAFFLLLCFLIPSSTVNAQQTEPVPSPPAASADQPEQEPAAPLTDSQKAEIRGDILMARKQYAAAVLLYEEALKLDRRRATLMNKIGIAYHQQMELDKARKYYQRALKADKNYGEVRNNLGALYYDMRKYRQSVNEFRKAIALRPELAAAHSGLGSALFARKKYEEALGSFRRAVELDPEIFERKSMFGSVVQSRAVADRGLFYFFLAKSFALQGDAERCAHYLRRARDDGYGGVDRVKDDPAFAAVLKDPLVQEVLNPPAAASVPPPPAP